MNSISGGLTVSLLITVVVLSVVITEAKHWPDFSCHTYKEITRQQNAIKFHRIGWNSCKYSHANYKQECDKMCVLRKREVVVRSKKEDPFAFHIDAFITLMLKELGYMNQHRKEAPQQLVDKVTAELEVCKIKHRDFENMTNVECLPCEPYNNLFQCVHNATGCQGSEY